jgi:hypothetical protein
MLFNIILTYSKLLRRVREWSRFTNNCYGKISTAVFYELLSFRVLTSEENMYKKKRWKTKKIAMRRGIIRMCGFTVL